MHARIDRGLALPALLALSAGCSSSPGLGASDASADSGDAITVFPHEAGGSDVVLSRDSGRDSGIDATQPGSDAGSSHDTGADVSVQTFDAGADAHADATKPASDAEADGHSDAEPSSDAHSDAHVHADGASDSGLTACTLPSDCPATGSECVVATCSAGVCGTTDPGTSQVLTTGQTAGDCQEIVCNGAGGTESVGDPTDLPTSSTVCKVPQCTGAPLAPSFTNAATGTSCVADGTPPNQVCGDTTNAAIAGTCVQCNVGADCTSGVCSANVCQVATCSDGVQNQNETSIDCGGVCGTCTVLMLGAGAGSTVGGEFHPNVAWVASTTLGGESVDGLALTFLNGGSSALGVMRYTQLGNANDNSIQSTLWTPGAWTAFANVGTDITSFEAPSVGATGATGASALAAFLGENGDYYYLTYSAATWSAAAAIQPAGGSQSAGSGAPSFDGLTGTLAFGGDNQNLYVEPWSGTAWGAATDVDTTDLTSLAPTVVGLSSTTALDVYVRASDGQVFSSALAAGTWGAPVTVTGATTNARVAVARTKTGAMLAFQGQDGNLYTSTYAAGAWGAVAAFATPNVATSAAPALTHGVGAATAELGYLDANGVANHARLIGGAWTAPVAVGGASLENLTIASSP